MNKHQRTPMMPNSEVVTVKGASILGVDTRLIPVGVIYTCPVCGEKINRLEETCSYCGQPICWEYPAKEEPSTRTCNRTCESCKFNKENRCALFDDRKETENDN